MKAFLRVAVILIMSVQTYIRAEPAGGGPVQITPIEHASMVIRHENTTLYIDPVGPREAYARLPRPDIILITHLHHDHFDPDLIAGLKTEKTILLGPKSVIDTLKYGSVLAAGETRTLPGATVTAVPAYNMTPERLVFHPRSRGDNGYVIAIGGQRLYVSGDTEDTPEMRALKNIDHAFICMNLPYTMTEEQAASAVLEMKPRVVTPYHYRGSTGVSDLKTFKRLVEAGDSHIRIALMDWYPPHHKPAP